MKILVTGAQGTLGRALVAGLASRAEILSFGRNALDIADPQAASGAVKAAAPDAIINCAAYNDVDAAEDHAIEALAINAFAVRTLARAAAAAGATFVHYSTDFVFDGTASHPYVETDRPAPQSVYAASKLLGEWFAVDAPRAYVLRLASLFGGSRIRSSVERMIVGVRQGNPVRAFMDRTVTPSYAEDVVEATWHMLQGDRAPGLYHCVNTGVVTWFELAQEIGRQLRLRAEVVPISVSDVPLKARRPRYAALSNAKLAAAGIVMPHWRDAIVRCLRLPELFVV